MDLTLHRQILRDLRRALDYYESRGGQVLGDRFFKAAEDCIDRIRKRPEGHHFSDGGYRRASLNTFPYPFLYEINSVGIWVAVLRHASDTRTMVSEGNRVANKTSILTTDTQRVESFMIVQLSTQKSERALGQA